MPVRYIFGLTNYFCNKSSFICPSSNDDPAGVLVSSSIPKHVPMSLPLARGMNMPNITQRLFALATGVRHLSCRLGRKVSMLTLSCTFSLVSSFGCGAEADLTDGSSALEHRLAQESQAQATEYSSSDSCVQECLLCQCAGDTGRKFAECVRWTKPQCIKACKSSVTYSC